jgi:sugar phosphate isomerase/epimerase
MRQTGLLSVTFRNRSFEEIIKLTADAKLDGIEWGGDVHLPPGELKLARQIGQATRDAGLINFSYGSYWHADCEPEMIAETAAELGVQWIRIWAGTLSSSTCTPEIRQKTVKYIQELCRHAGTMQIAAEKHHNTLTDNAESACKLLNEVAEDNFFCYFQQESNCDNQKELAKLPQERIRAIHVQYCVDNQRLPLKNGFNEWIKLLANIPQNAPALLEFVQNNSVEQYLEDANILKQLANGGAYGV